MRKTAATNENSTTGSIWVDPGVPTLPEAEKLIASLMLASRPDLPNSACVVCHVLQEKLAGHYFIIINRYNFNRKTERKYKRQQNS
ncbi:hypothetical protein ACLKA7_000514 [Drosophila subpalustris]